MQNVPYEVMREKLHNTLGFATHSTLPDPSRSLQIVSKDVLASVFEPKLRALQKRLQFIVQQVLEFSAAKALQGAHASGVNLLRLRFGLSRSCSALDTLTL
jgi:hypothetical protein